MTGISNNFNFSFWNTEKSDALNMLTLMIESSANSINRHENFDKDVRYRLLLEDMITMADICKNIMNDGEDKSDVSENMDKIIDELTNMQEYMRKKRVNKLDTINDKLDVLLEK